MDIKKRIISQIEKLKKILLPYFPDSAWLKKHWWHRLVLFIAFVISASSFYTILFFGIIFIMASFNLAPSGFLLALFYIFLSPMYIPVTILAPLNLSSITLNLNLSYSSSSILYVVTLIILAFLPSLLYRLILFIAFGEAWKSKNK